MARSNETEVTRASRIRAPHDRGRTANDFGHKVFTCTDTIARNALSYVDFSGKWIILENTGSNTAFFAFSSAADAVVDPTVTASAAGESNQAGQRIASGQILQMQLPYWEKAETVYFCRICDTAGTATLDMAIGEGE